MEKRDAETQMTAGGDTGNTTGLIKLKENRCAEKKAAHKTRRVKDWPHPQINIHEDRGALRNTVKREHKRKQKKTKNPPPVLQ